MPNQAPAVARHLNHLERVAKHHYAIADKGSEAEAVYNHSKKTSRREVVRVNAFCVLEVVLTFSTNVFVLENCSGKFLLGG